MMNQPDTVRLALFGQTSGWVSEDHAETPGNGPQAAAGNGPQSAGNGPQSAAESGPQAARWRTPSGLRVALFQDALLGRPVLELDAGDDERADAEAEELERQLPRLFELVRYPDARQAFSDPASDRGWILPLLAATVAGRSEPPRAEVLSAAVAGLGAADSQARAGAVLAAAYLDDVALLARVSALASSDPDPRVRALARKVTRQPSAGLPPDGGEPQSDGLRRIAFVAERVREEFLPFAADLGWELAGHQPGSEDESERFTWRPEPGIEVALIADIRLDRELVTLVAAEPGGHRTLDLIEARVREWFETVDSGEALDMLAEAPDGPARMTALKVVAASAPASYQPRFLATMAEMFGHPATPLRGFATGASIYFPWPEIVPFLAWMARHDPDPGIRGIAKVGLGAVDLVYSDRLGQLVPPVSYHRPAAGGTDLLRRIHVPPEPIDQRLGDDLLWRAVDLHPGFPDGYHEISFDEAGQVAGRLAAQREGRE